MKLIGFILIFFIILTTLNLTFLVEISKDQELNNFYFKGNELSNNYSELEKIHMQEVKSLVNISLIINLLLLSSLFFLKKPNYKQIGISLISISILLFIFSLSFQTFFHNFHLLIFNSENWVLPAESKLIGDYPLNYFRNKFLLINSVILLSGLGFYLKDLIFSNSSTKVSTSSGVLYK